MPADEPEQLALFGVPGVDLQALRMERERLAEERRAAATRKAYTSDWRDWTAWCDAAGKRPLPASPDSLSLYVVSMAQRGKSVATIERRLCAIVARHAAAGEPSPAPKGGDVRELVLAVRRKLGTAPRAKAALMASDLVVCLEALPKTDRGVRDRAVLVLGFASGLRRSELAALQLEDVDIVREGLRLRIGRSKTDQEGAGRLFGVHRGKRALTCPVRALEAWLQVRGDWAGPLFTPVRYYGEVVRQGINGDAIAGIVQRAAARAGLDPAKYGGHSLRAGCATEAAARGAGESAIMERTGHRSVGMVRRYIRHATIFARDPLDGAL